MVTDKRHSVRPGGERTCHMYSTSPCFPSSPPPPSQLLSHICFFLLLVCLSAISLLLFPSHCTSHCPDWFSQPCLVLLFHSLTSYSCIPTLCPHLFCCLHVLPLHLPPPHSLSIHLPLSLVFSVWSVQRKGWRTLDRVMCIGTDVYQSGNGAHGRPAQ